MKKSQLDTVEHIDTIIIGAGVSGISAGHHLSQHPNLSFAIFERRDVIGGTWDLFRYPGIRSDSDMYTFGYNFKPWTKGKTLASGPDIREYVTETAAEAGIDHKIRFGHSITKAVWSSSDRKWHLTVEIKDNKKPCKITCSFLFCCSGYYNYNHGYLPEFKGYNDFKGLIVHPQSWPEGLEYTDKNILVIGSGATAVTIVPAMTDKAAHVIMLQRSPTYIASLPEVDKIALWLRRLLPVKLAYRLSRLKNILFTLYIYNLSHRKPKMMKKFFVNTAKKALGPNIDVKHFRPDYNPWQQRLCAIPDNDLFNVIRDGQASIITDHIDTFTDKGVKLQSGQEIEADIIIPATGLEIQFFGGMELWLDDKKVNTGDLLNYKGMMFSNVPNFAATFGYTNSSWTLKADLTSDYIAKLLSYMQKHDYDQVVPFYEEGSQQLEDMLDFKSGYIERAKSITPKKGSKRPWRNKHNYISDFFAIKFAKFNDGVLKFSNKTKP